MNIKETITSHAEKAMADAVLLSRGVLIDPAPPVLASPLIWAASAIWLYFVKKEKTPVMSVNNKWQLMSNDFTVVKA